ncbi:hypothetical protein F0U60_03425 [Archangium minus]|uniref:Uncharacterized protein n=1 Tax=Archangium minus TaxID=83450 RepID=A0ABY9WNB7_9BACT|nr:hypothetical protein F0U60_03425 [Archangium minus]
MWNAIQKASKSVLAMGIVFSSMTALATEWFDTTAAERAATGYPISNRDKVGWAYASRSANEVCLDKGFPAGQYLGHQSGELMGVNCFDDDTVDWFDTTLTELKQTFGWGRYVDDKDHIDAQLPVWANLVAYYACYRRGYGAGFFTGHQSGELVGLHCIPRDRVHTVFVPANDRPDGWSWVHMNITANDVCASHGYRTGILYDYIASGEQPLWVNLKYNCFN